MKKTNYRELADYVGDMILFNNHAKHNEFWYYGIYQQPLLTELLEKIDEEIAKEAGILPEELGVDSETPQPASVLDFDIYQTYHITQRGAEFLLNRTSELVSYDEELEIYLWHVCHWGTSWSVVNVDIHECEDWQGVEKFDQPNNY